ncbi:uncharacterized protein TNCV_3674661 [Trichonephila clavipes]|nr:uncharacterized protein TNCV_3674661 [Trichonephila clavipes]
MSVKVHFRHSHLDYFPENIGAVSEEQEERFHQDIKEMERRYQGRLNVSMMADYCWMLKWENSQEHKRKIFNQNVTPQSMTTATPMLGEERKRHKMLSWRCSDCSSKIFITGLCVMELLCSLCSLGYLSSDLLKDDERKLKGFVMRRDRKCFDSTVYLAINVFNVFGHSSCWGTLDFLLVQHIVFPLNFRAYNHDELKSCRLEYPGSNYNPHLGCTELKMIAIMLLLSTKLCLMLFLVDNFQSYTAYCVLLIEGRADLMLQNANAVLRNVHREVWLHVALLLPQLVCEPYFVWFTRSLMPALP